MEHSPTRTPQNMDSTLSISPVSESIGMALQGGEINRVGLRLPEFTSADPELWFSILDRSFQAAGITADSTKFGYALTAIGPRYTLEIRDIIMSSPSRKCLPNVESRAH